MNHKNIVTMIGSLAIIGSLAFMYMGCEDGPGTSELDNYFADNPYTTTDRPGSDTTSQMTIRPLTATCTYVGQKIHFRVAGGSRPYRWGVAKSTRGSIAQTVTEEAVYTVKDLLENTVIVYDRKNRAVTALVTPESAATLKVIPSSLIMNNGGPYIFDIVGGVSPYGAHLSDATTGNLVVNGSQVTFTAGAPLVTTNVTLSVFDDDGSTATASITIK